jgi:hypothetical protein
MKRILRLLLLTATVLIIIFTAASCGEEAKRGVESAVINENGEVVVTFSDGAVENLGRFDTDADTAPAIQISNDGYWIVKGTKTEIKAEGKDDAVSSENVQGLDFYLLYDGTYGVKAGGAINAENIVIPPTYKQIKVTQILQNAFYNARNLKSIAIPEGITSIGSHSFYACSALTEAEIPGSVDYIGNGAFFGCDSLEAVRISDITKWCKIDFASHSANPTYYAKKLYVNGELLTNLVIPEGVTEIKSYAFSGCSQINRLTLPKSVTSVGEGAFYRCANLTSVTVSEGLTVASIGKKAFTDCFKLAEIINKSSINITKGSLANGALAYYAIEIHNGESKTVNKDNYLFYTYGNSGYLIGYTGNDTVLTLPESYNGQGYEIYNYAFAGFSDLTAITIPRGVTAIGDYAFSDCSRLTSLTIPDSVASIGEGALAGCSGLTALSLPFIGAARDGDKNTHLGYIFGGGSYNTNNSYVPASLKTVTVTDASSINQNAFYYCNNLTTVNIPDSVISIGDSAFYHCESLTGFKIPDNVSFIGDSAFYYCKSLTDVTIPSGVTSISEYAFYYCSGITSVTMPKGITSIGRRAFYGCSGITGITLPDAVTSIGYEAFQNCESLVGITIPHSVTSIDNYAFWNCSSLADVYYKGTEEDWGGISIFYGNEILTSANIHYNCTEYS